MAQTSPIASLDNTAPIELQVDFPGDLPEDPPATTSKVSNDELPESALGIYFRDLGADSILTSDQEIELAKVIEAHDREVWAQLLSFAPITERLLDAVTASMATSFAGFAEVSRAAQTARKSRTKASRARLLAAATTLGPSLRAADLDRVHLRAALAELASLGRQNSTGHDRQRAPRFSTHTQSYRDYRRRLEAAQRLAQRARDEFVRANLRLVVSIARRYMKGPMPLADLIQEGNLGLIKAVDRFDHERGFRFSTYASWWIRHAVGRALADKGREVRVPVHMVDANYRLNKARRELSSKLGRQPTQQELAQATDTSIRKLRQMSVFLVGHSVSFDQPVASEDNRPLLEVFQDPATEDCSLPEDITRRRMTNELRNQITDLSDIEEDIVRRRFGLDGVREHTLQEIADEYGRSRERIRQIQSRALGKLRRHFEQIHLV